MSTTYSAHLGLDARNWAAVQNGRTPAIVRPMKTLFHLIAAIIMAVVVIYALQPDTKRLVFSAPGIKLETK